ncbi:GNAT family N-acetyltransferase [Vibrio sonorensis]|uniref:GNAT family N-acetyltransferase n=1 Tax=Vibrio sonorensis TaxID=1004316 RepID=UPI0008D90291|nr:GNAT family N-acetyltransferase [Vibrio sonorensis]
MEIVTERLRLRQWTEGDKQPFREMGSDQEVMRFFPNLLSAKQSDAAVDRISNLIDENGWGFWAVEERSSGQFIGFVGLHGQEEEQIPCTPMVEIGWRLAREHWGKGYAPEAAKAALKYAFDSLGESRIYAFTSLLNLPSQRVMEKIGMHNTGLDFDHPKVPDGHRLEKHCLFRIDKEYWLENQDI